MEWVAFIAIVSAGIILALVIIGSTVLMSIRLLKGGLSRQDRETADEEARMIQGIYQGLAKMEKRVEALETLIMETERKDRPR